MLFRSHFHKMRFYFDDWGCMRCEKKGVMYGANGMCCRCAQKVQHRVVSSFRKRQGTTLPLTRSPEVCSRVESAKALLLSYIASPLTRRVRDPHATSRSWVFRYSTAMLRDHFASYLPRGTDRMVVAEVLDFPGACSQGPSPSK